MGAPKPVADAEPAAAIDMTPWETEAQQILQRRGQAPAKASAPTPVRETGSWTIALVVTRDRAAADAALDRVRNGGGLTDAFIVPRPRDFLIATGRFDDARGPEASAALKRVRATTVGDDRPFASAMLTPLASEGEGLVEAGGDPALDLANVRKDPANRDKVYTLQIAVYGRTDNRRPSAAELAEFRKAAQDAAAKLRSEGEEAYFVHGPNYSMVTVGAFTVKDYNARAPRTGDSPALKETRARFPNHLVNGQGRRVRGKLEEPFLVEIPE